MKLLVDFAEQQWANSESLALRLRHLMLYDLFIKARSYAILNKVFFVLALISGIALLIWPALAFTLDSLQIGFSAIVQTSVTGFAALMFALYGHYKKRQAHAENLMRHLVFSADASEESFESILKELERIDQGFVFSDVINKNPKANALDKALDKSKSPPV